MLADNFTEISCRPRKIQRDHSVVTVSREDISKSGERCYLDEHLTEAFAREAANVNRWKKIIAVNLMVLAAILAVWKIVSAVKAISALPYLEGRIEHGYIADLIVHIVLSFIGVIIPVIMAVLGAVLLNRSAKKSEEKLRSGVDGQTECYKFRCYGLLRYTYTSGGDAEHDYYADLKEFSVELFNPSDKWERAKYVYGVIINQSGRDKFILFNDVE